MPEEIINHIYKENLNFLSANDVAASKFLLLGKGMFGTAYLTEQHEVLKLHKKEDRAYIGFVKFVLSVFQNHPGARWLKHFPAIRYYGESEDIVLVVMERLYLMEELREIPSSDICRAVTEKGFDNTQKAIDEVTGRFIHKMSLMNKAHYYARKWVQFKVISSLEEALTVVLFESYKSSEYCCDLHSANLLFRKNGCEIEAVIIDPFTLKLGVI